VGEQVAASSLLKRQGKMSYKIKQLPIEAQ